MTLLKTSPLSLCSTDDPPWENMLFLLGDYEPSARLRTALFTQNYTANLLLYTTDTGSAKPLSQTMSLFKKKKQPLP